MARPAVPKSNYASSGYRIRSEFVLPELDPAGSSPAVPSIDIRRVRFKKNDFARCTKPLHDYFYETLPGLTRLYWPGEVRIEIRGGREILAEAEHGMDARSLRLCLLGPALATALRQRGHVVLHASCVREGRNGFAFLGPAGAGKSTLALALARRGFSLVTDNVLAIHNGRTPLVWRSQAQIKCSPDIFSQYAFSAGRHERVEADNPKRSVLLKSTGRESAAFLRRVYVLGQGVHAAIRPVNKCQALLEMARHPCGIVPAESDARPEHFSALARIASRVPFFSLTHERGLSHLEAFVDLVERAIRS